MALTDKLAAIANAIRAKTGGTATMTLEEMPSEIESIPSGGITPSGAISITENDTYDVTQYAEAMVNVIGGTIRQGIVITALSSNDYPTSADIYGNVPPYAFGNYSSSAVSMGMYLASVTFKGETTRIGSGAFQKTALTSITIPDSVDSIGVQAFRGNTALANYIHENARNLYGHNGGAVHALYGMGHLAAMQLGAVGKPVTDLSTNAFANITAPSSAIVTVYCVGERVEGFLTNMRSGLTTQTIIFKASGATTYGGVSYAAGETMLTSEVA